MAIATVEALLDALRRYPLLEPGQMGELTPEYAVRFPDARELARDLLERGWLTPYQINQIILGNAADLLLGSYVLLERLGDGGMGQVFKARNWKLGKIVAIKIIRRDRRDRLDPALVRRFRREIQAAAQLAHPNVVLAYDAGQVGDTHFIAMEYVEGVDLTRQVRRTGPLSVRDACEYVRQAALGLQHAHERGLIHRDIKPSNLLLANASRDSAAAVIKIVDMGLARVQPTDGEPSLSAATVTGTIMGTPDFIAPEQARDAQNADARSDLYSLGCTFYYLLTARPPFPEGSVTEKLLKHNMEEPAPVERLRPDVPAKIAAIVRTLMAKDPARRFQTAAELASALADVLHGVPVAPAVAVLPFAPDFVAETLAPPGPESRTSAGADASSSASGRTDATTPDRRPSSLLRRGRGRRVWLWRVAGTAALAATFAVVLAFVVRGRRAPATPTGPPLPVTVRIDAVRPWQDTGVEVRAGARLTLRAEGHWHGRASRPLSDVSANGSADAPRDRAVLPEAPMLCLLGRVGASEPFVVGTSRTLPVPTAGRLFLRANTLDLDDKVGSLEVVIEGGESADGPAPLPAPTRLEAVEAGLRALQDRAGDPASNRDAVRTDVLDFALKNPTTFQANRARALLARLPSPLDALAPEKLLDPAKRLAGLGGPDRLPAGLVAVVGDGRLRHWREVEALAWSPDGKTLVSGSEDGSLSVWDSSTGALRRHLFGHSAGVQAVVFDPDGLHLVSGGMDGAIKVWDTGSGKEVAAAVGSSNVVLCLAWVVPGKKLASGGRDGQVRIWDTETWKNPRQLKSGAGVLSLAWSEAAKRLAAGCGDGQVRVWDLSVDAEPTILKAQAGPVHGVAWRPDGKQLAVAGTDGTLRLWEPGGTAEPRVLKGAGNGRTTLAWNAKGTILASAGGDAAVRLWKPQPRAADDKSPAVLRYPAGAVRCLAWAPEGDTLAAGNVQGVIRLWDGAAEKPKPPDPGTPLAGHALAWAPDAHLLTIAWFESIRFWEPAPGGGAPPRWRLFGRHPGAIAALAFSPDGRALISGGNNGTLIRWDLATGKEAQPAFQAHPNGVLGVTFAPDGKTFASCGKDHTVKLWESATGKALSTLPGHTDQVKCLAFSPDGRLLASGGQEGTVKVWEVAGGTQRHALSTPRETGPVTAVAFSPDGSLLVSASAAPPLIELWDPVTGRRLRPLAGNKDRPASLSWRPDGALLASGTSGGEVWLWDSATGEVRDRLQVGPVQGPVQQLAYSPDGRYLATANGNGTVYILRLSPPPDGGKAR
jgi:WD40 repeat protein/serine/threonine protein kinase